MSVEGDGKELGIVNGTGGVSSGGQARLDVLAL
jgi:hypothetical protein